MLEEANISRIFPLLSLLIPRATMRSLILHSLPICSLLLVILDTPTKLHPISCDNRSDENDDTVVTIVTVDVDVVLVLVVVAHKYEQRIEAQRDNVLRCLGLTDSIKEAANLRLWFKLEGKMQSPSREFIGGRATLIQEMGKFIISLHFHDLRQLQISSQWYFT